MATTAERLHQIMQETHLRQADIIERAKSVCAKYGGKLTRQDLSQYCNGKVVPKQDKLFILAVTLNVSEPWLMGYNVARERTYNIEIESTNHEGAKERISAYLEKFTDAQIRTIQSIAELSEDARDSILHQIEYEHSKEMKRRIDAQGTT